MLKHIAIASFFFLTFLETGCNNPIKNPVSATEKVALWVDIAKTQVRETPDINSKVIAEVSYNDKVYFMDIVSDNTTAITLRNVQYNEPWLKVNTADNREGWVYAGAMRFDANAPQLKELLTNRRLRSFFGNNIAHRVINYQNNYQAIKTAADFANTYREAKALQDTLVTLISEKINLLEVDYTDSLAAPNLFWLKDYLPALQPQIVGEGSMYQLFMDFNVLKQKAATTTDTVDDEFIQINEALFPDDKIEFFFPSYTIQINDYEAASLLGRGKHTQILELCTALSTKTTLFQPEITQIVATLVDDIVLNPHFWETADKAQTELSSILQKNYPVLSQTDIIALQTRQKQLKNAAANKIKTNLLEGF